MDKWMELFEEAKVLVGQAQEILVQDEISGEDHQKASDLLEAAKAKKAKAVQLRDIQIVGGELADELKQGKMEWDREHGDIQFKKLGQMLVEVHRAGNPQYRGPWHPSLKMWKDSAEAGTVEGKQGWEGEVKATMSGAVGATGGFLIPDEFLPDLYGEDWETNSIRGRATVIPMRRRSLRVPVVDQTGTTAGVPSQFGGMIATWTEEGGEKDQNDPTFRQIELVAWKLVCYTRATDELLDDEAIGLEAFLRGPLGFGGAVAWHEEAAFLHGTGVGQPLGVLNAGATISVPRQAAGSINVPDITDMLSHAYGDNLVWHISRAQMSNLLQLNGPSGNASYLFVTNMRDGPGSTLMGYPIIWTEKLPGVGTAGDVVLADWRYYLVGDRQSTTIDSTNVERFKYDETSWRAVHRVGGRPWLSTPWTGANSHQLSPFVILGAKTT